MIKAEENMFGIVSVCTVHLLFLSFAFALLGHLHLLVVIFNKMRCQHVELFHPQRSRPFLCLLICYLQTQATITRLPNFEDVLFFHSNLQSITAF